MFVHSHNGVGFRDFIAHMVRMKHARTYIEVGVRNGATLAMVDCDAIGVDPFFQFNTNPMGKKRALHLFQETSDEFFRDRDVKAILGKPIDVVFSMVYTNLNFSYAISSIAKAFVIKTA